MSAHLKSCHSVLEWEHGEKILATKITFINSLTIKLQTNVVHKVLAETCCQSEMGYHDP